MMLHGPLAPLNPGSPTSVHATYSKFANFEYTFSMRPVDMVVAAKLVSVAITGATYQGLSESLGISASEAHSAAKRLIAARLFRDKSRHVPYPYRQALLEFWVHGLKYVYPAQLGAPTRGMVTSFGAQPLADHFPTTSEGPPVWPSAEGTFRGPALSPLHPSAMTASGDERVYELLTLIDALRAGRAREQQLARELLKDRLYRWC